LQYVFSANGALSFEPGATPQDSCGSNPSAESAIQNVASASVPDIAFVEFDAMFAQKVAILLLKTAGAMMFLLISHVLRTASS
jgi:hypothetical protein